MEGSRSVDFFFFQAEDGIRDLTVTGVQTCALPIYDLPNPYRLGLSWGQLPNGRKWGSTAGIAIGTDGNIWAIDRCGAFGSQGTNSADSPLDPALEFDPSGKFLNGFAHRLFVSPHKITVDKDGNLWVADNGLKDGRGQQVFKFNQDGKLLLTLGKAGAAGPGSD